MTTNKVPDSAYAKKSGNSFFEMKPAVQRQESNAIAIPEISPKVIEAIKEELAGLPFTFDRIRIPTGGSLVFEIPTEDIDKPLATTEIVGVIIDHYPARVFWNSQNITNSAPSCMSIDMENGIGEPGGKCNKCPYYRWGSKGNGIGRACKEIRRVYILCENNPMPYEFNLPPTSIKNFTNYIKRIALKGLRSYQVVTKISLQKATNKDGITYSQAVFSFAGELNDNVQKRMEQYANEMRKLTRRIVINEPEEDIEVEHEEDTTDNIVIDNFEEAPQNNDNDLPF